MKTLDITPDMAQELGRVERAIPYLADEPKGVELFTKYKVALADAVMAAYLAQRAPLLAKLPARGSTARATLRLVERRERG